MKRIYLMLTHVDSYILRIIRYYTGAKYNHISISLDSDMKSFYSFGRKNLYFPIIGGFKREELNKGLFLYFKNASCAIYALDIDELAYEKLKEHLDSFISNNNKYKYNHPALFGIMIKRPMEIKNRYTCSQFVATILQQSGIYGFNKHNSLVTPEDFNSIPGLVKVYEGKMCDVAY